jgi:hypothetical protein
MSTGAETLLLGETGYRLAPPESRLDWFLLRRLKPLARTGGSDAGIFDRIGDQVCHIVSKVMRAGATAVFVTIVSSLEPFVRPPVGLCLVPADRFDLQP